MLRKFPTLLAAVAAAPPAAAAAGGAPHAAGLMSAGEVLATVAAVLLLAVIAVALCRRASRQIAKSIDRRKMQQILSEQAADKLDDFILPGAYGGLTHIDHSVLTASGIFCIQTKYCSGTVSGAPDEPQWTNIDGGQRRRFLNPLIQNEGRTRALQKLAPDVPVANVVVFSDAVRFAGPIAGNVVRLSDLRNYMATYEFRPCDEEKLGAVWQDLRTTALTDEDSRKDFHAQLSFS